MPRPDWCPLIGGHEGAGVVEKVGPGVTEIKPGDHVGMSWIPACGRCRWCVLGQGYLCGAGANLFTKEMTTDGTVRRHLDGKPLMATTQLGTFSEYAVVAQNSVIKVDPSLPFHARALVSCGVTTGWGSATIAAGTQPGDTVVIIGTGGVGMNSVQGARSAGAGLVVAVDPVESKRDAAAAFGATHTSPRADQAFELVRQLTHGVMADRVVVTVGVISPDLIPVAMALTRKGGTCVLTSLTEMSIPLMLVDLVNSCRQLKGTLYGGMNPRASMPMLLSMYPGRPAQARRVGQSPLPARRDQRCDGRSAGRKEHQGRDRVPVVHPPRTSARPSRPARIASTTTATDR